MGLVSRRWRFGWCEYIEISRTLIVHGQRSDLRGKPLDLLLLLLTSDGKVVPGDTLIESIWGNASRQSLTVSISKLRKAFGGDTDAIIQNVLAEGYRMAVPVHETIQVDSAEPALTLSVGDPIPGKSYWTAVARLGGPDDGPVWLSNNDLGEQRVFKFAMDGVRLRTLQREENVAGLLGRSGAPAEGLRRVDDFDFSQQPYYLAGEYVGPDLLAFSETPEFTSMSRGDRVKLIADLCDSVATAHAVGVLHNDLKPSNILVRRCDASQATPRYAMVLIDFGDSSLLDEALQSHLRADGDENVFDMRGHSSGTSHSEMYRAPEVRFDRSFSVEADIYSLGIILYQTVARDFQHVPSGGWQQYVNDALLEAQIARAAHRDPHERFRTAAAMADALHSLEQTRALEQQRAQAQLHALQVQHELERAKAARPWIVSALLALSLGLLISGFFYRSAARQRDIAQRENRSLQAMLTFLSEDVLAQSNPGSGVNGSDHAVDLTLSDAIRNSVKQIERRFPQDPLIAGRLHETIADGLRARTQFVEADEQYMLAGEAYRSVDGSLSQDAIAVELKRDAARLSGLLPDAIVLTRRDFDRQVALIHQARHPSAEVLALADFVESGLIGLQSDPARAIPILQRGIRTAETAPGFDPMLLLWIKGRLCGLYVRLQDGPKLQAAAENRIREITARFGRDSPLLVSYEMYLEEAFFLQGKYSEAIAQADRNYPRFQRLLGDQSQYTLAVLATRAASLAQLGRYKEAAENDLQLSKLESGNPSGTRIRVGSLNDAAMFSCRSGDLVRGLENARLALREAGPGPTSLPGYYNGARFALAECMLAEQEASSHPNPSALRSVLALLQQVDAGVIAQQTGDKGYDSLVDLARARVALLTHDRDGAARNLAKVNAFFSQPDCDPYELQQYRRVTNELHSQS